MSNSCLNCKNRAKQHVLDLNILLWGTLSLIEPNMRNKKVLKKKKKKALKIASQIVHLLQKAVSKGSRMRVRGESLAGLNELSKGLAEVGQIGWWS